MASKTVRDFMYLDTDNLYSLYSQVFEGVVEEIVESFSNQDTDRSSSGSLKKAVGDALDTEVVEASSQTKNRILHDHIYNRFEERVGKAVTQLKSLDKENIDQISSAFLVKVRGKVEIEDYNRIRDFTQKFNQLTEAIAYAAISNDENVKIILEKHDYLKTIERQMRTAKGPEKTELQKQKAVFSGLLEATEVVRLVQKGSNLLLDQKLLDYFASWFDFFYPNGFEITIVPDDSEVVFRGIIDRQFLRLNPDYLRALFGNFIAAEWVMVGQITYVPGTKIPEVEEAEKLPATPEINTLATENDVSGEVQTVEVNDPLVPLVERMKAQAQKEENPSLRDPVRGLFKRSAAFDKMFFESNARSELLMRPLAIYREFKVALLDSSDEQKS